MKSVIVSILCVIFLIPGLWAQNKHQDIANAQFHQKDYVSAIKSYKKALRKSEDFDEQKTIAEQIAFSYYEMNDYENAMDWFEDAVGDKTDNIDAYLCYAELLLIEQRYDDTENILKRARQLGLRSQEIDRRLLALAMLRNNRNMDSLGIIKNLESLNTSFSDYGLGIWDNKLVFASTRIDQQTDGRTGEGYSELFYTQLHKSNSKGATIKKMPTSFRSANNDGTFSFDPNYQTAYWTRCADKSKQCRIYSSVYNPTKKQWAKPKSLNFMIEGYQYGHPFPSSDGKTLFFSSNIPNGFGQNDIWKINRKADGSWGIPVNLGENINTEGNEVFPSHSGDSLLFFSSDNWNSVGRLDIFFSMVSGIHYSKPVNLGYPVNSAADDFSLLLLPNGAAGYFCSNRIPGQSDDIYSFTGFPIKLVAEGKVRHALDGELLEDVRIVYTNSREKSDTVSSNSKGQYLLYLSAFDDYRLTAVKPGYHKEERRVNTNDISQLSSAQPQFTIDFQLSKTAFPCTLKGLIVNRDDKKPMEGVMIEIWSDGGFATYVRSNVSGEYQFDDLKPNTIYHIRSSENGYFKETRDIKLPILDKACVLSKENGYDADFELTKIQTQSEVVLSNIYYDLDKSSLRTSSRVELLKLASMLHETPSVVVQINSHTDTRGTAEYNMKLSAQRAQSVINYLVELGIDRDRLVAKGYGENQPLIKNATTEEEHQANRRTSFKVLDVVNTNVLAKEEVSMHSGPSYRIQLLSTSQRRDIQKDFKNIHERLQVKVYEQYNGQIFKYEAGDRKTLAKVKELQLQLEALGYSDCFVVSYLGDKKISIQEAKKLEIGID